MQIKADQSQRFPPSTLVSTHLRPAQENPEHFSKIIAVGRQHEIVQILQILEPRLVDLTVLVTGGQAVIHGDIGLGRLVPLAFMGEGISRLLTIILAVASSPYGMVLIDEVEVGFHYSVMQKVWTAIAKAAREYDVQVFATTHSYECIEAAHRASEDGSDDDFRLHRLDRVGDTIKATTYSEETLGTSIRTEMEVR